MKYPKRLFMLLVVADFLACGKEKTAPVGDQVRVKTFTSEAQLRQALGSFLTGYDHSLRTFDRLAGEYEFYMAWSPKSMEKKPYNSTRIIMHSRHGDDRTREAIISRDPYYVAVDDSRLNNPLYSNIIILTYVDNKKLGWHYKLYVMYRKRTNITEEVDLSGGFSIVGGAAGEAEWFAQAPEPSTDKEVVTALFNLLEPGVVD